MGYFCSVIYTWTNVCRLDNSNAFQTSVSLFDPVGSKLSLNEPENSTGSCGIIVSLDRRLCRPNFEMSWPSINILPPAASTIRNSASVNDDFPKENELKLTANVNKFNRH